MTAPYDLEQRRHRKSRRADQVEQLETLTDELARDLGPNAVVRLVRDQLVRSLTADRREQR